MVDCMLPADVHEPSDLERAYIQGARGRFYRVRWDTVMVEPSRGSTWAYVRLPSGTEVVQATASGLPSATMEAPRYFGAGGEPIHRDQVALTRGQIGAGERWIPTIAIIRDRLVHGWTYGIDLAALPQSLIAANALRYDIAVQRCAQDADRRAAEADQRAAIAAGLDVRRILTAPSTTNDATAEGATRDILTRGTLLIRPDGSKATGDEVVTTQRSGMAVAILGTLGVVGALGLIAWAMSGESR